MKKNAIIFGVFLFAGFTYAQEGRVGINTTSPNATLDVSASATDLTRTDGLIAPKLKGTELKAKDANYDTAQTGAIVYVTEALDGNSTTPEPEDDTTTKTVNVTSIGYYYFDGLVWQKISDTKSYQEPWNISGTNNPAESNTQNIYQAGKVAVGNNPGSAPIARMNVYESYAGADANGSTYGINTIFSSNSTQGKAGINNEFTDNSTSGSGTNYGVYSIFNDYSTVGRAGYGGYFVNRLYAGRTNPTGATLGGVWGDVIVSPTGSASSPFTFGAIGSASARLNNGDYSGTSFRGASFSAQIIPASGRNLTMTNDISGSLNTASLSGNGGTITAGAIQGVGADVNITSTSGSFTANVVAASRIRVSFGGNSANQITSLYGLYVNRGSNAATNTAITNAYGIYIDEWAFNGSNPATTYNLFSAGVGSKNYFQGRVGIGQNAPAAKLHVVKVAGELTPAIIEGCNVYADNAAAVAAGLPVGGLYRTATGQLMVRY